MVQLPSPFTSPIRRFSNDSGVVDVTADVLEDAVVVVVVVWVSEVVVSQILELQLVGTAFQTGGVCRRYHRVSQLPDAAYRVLEGAVAVDPA